MSDFLAWCAERGVVALPRIEPIHVAAWIEELGRDLSVPTVKQRLAGVRHLFDWLVRCQVIPTNPAISVRGPAYSVRRGKTPVLDPAEARELIDSIDVSTPIGLRDRALIGLMVYSFARVGAALDCKVEDVFVQNRRLWVRLHEKGGKRHEMPCHHNLDEYLHAYIDGCGLAEDRKGYLFRTIARGTGRLSTTPAPGQCLSDGTPTRAGGRDRHRHLQPQLPCDGDHSLSDEWRYARTRGRDGQPCLDPDDPAL
ncbi:tyrosine-type recombinase/integrase [Sphingomonas sp. I4]